MASPDGRGSWPCSPSPPCWPWCSLDGAPTPEPSPASSPTHRPLQTLARRIAGVEMAQGAPGRAHLSPEVLADGGLRRRDHLHAAQATLRMLRRDLPRRVENSPCPVTVITEPRGRVLSLRTVVPARHRRWAGDSGRGRRPGAQIAGRKSRRVVSRSQEALVQPSGKHVQARRARNVPQPHGDTCGCVKRNGREAAPHHRHLSDRCCAVATGTPGTSHPAPPSTSRTGADTRT